MSLHFVFAHSSHGEDFGIFSLGSSQHGLGIGSSVHDTGLMQGGSVLEVLVRIVIHFLGLASKMGVVERKGLAFAITGMQKVVGLLSCFISRHFI